MRRSRRRGQSMLELVAATTIITIALVPALQMTRKGIARGADLERAEMRLALCTSLLESEMSQTAATWNLENKTGDFRELGRPELRFAVTKSDALADGGIPDSLTTIEVLVWHDEDAGQDLDANEKQVRLSTKMAKLISYEYEATVH